MNNGNKSKTFFHRIPLVVRLCKWRDEGVLLTIFQELNAEPDFENLSIDSTCIKAHQHSAGAKKGHKS
ncbi:hypothetical protein [Bacillus cereus]|uniref:hypothetical protein n=1 Tax=Bacillus cereus TaxID=1396 RepID=UPI001CEF98E9|nr:hypothetical protein [Bacillus cereus]